MKKIISLALAFLCAALLSGCGVEEELPTGTAAVLPPTVPTTEATSPTEATAETGVLGITTNVEPLTIRAEPSQDAEAVGTVMEGTHVSIYETVTVEGQPWCRIDEGWIPGEYVRLAEVEPSQPSTLPDHTHEYSAAVVPPTCTENGYTVHTCGCGDRYWDGIVPAKGHTWGAWVTVKAATEEEAGLAERVCSVCGEKETKILPLEINDHVHQYTENVTQEATCIAEGVRTFICSCGDVYTETIPKKPHSYTMTVVSPTCTGDGYTLYTCRVCGNSYTGNLAPALGHSFTDTVVEPTCTEDGYTIHTCDRCGETRTDATVPALGHTWGEWVPSEDGTQSRTCTVCGEQETVPLPDETQAETEPEETLPKTEPENEPDTNP